MPKCCVDGCRTGFDGELVYFQCFTLNKLPPELRKKWIKKINRPKLEIKSHTPICARHFRKKDFVPQSENKDKFGRQRKQLRLKPTAVPSLYMSKNCPKEGCWN